MTKSTRIIWLLSTVVSLLICCILPIGCGSYNLVSLNQRVEQTPANLDLDGVMVTSGTLEVVVPRAQKPDEVFVSPTGRWLIFAANETSQWFIRDTGTGQDRKFAYDPYADLRWVNEEEFAAGWRIVKAIDLSALELKVFDTPENDIQALEILRGAKRVYLLPERGTGGVAVLSDDPDYPYAFDAFVAEVGQRPKEMGDSEYTYGVLTKQFPETEFVVVEPAYFQPTPGARQPNLTSESAKFYVNFDFPSPDGRFYARSEVETWETNITIYQCGKKRVAHTVKKNWDMYPKGWAYDSSGFYFLLRPKVGYFTAGEVPISILKLNIPLEVLANAPPYEGEGFCE